MQATAGIGDQNTSLSTQTSALSAQTATGGIYINNTGSLNINGGTIAGVNGVQVTSSGDIDLTSSGNINVTITGDVVSAPGYLNVSADGTTSSVQTGGNNGGPSGIPALASGLATFVDAGLDVLVGAAGSIGDVGGPNVQLNGRDVIINGGSTVAGAVGVLINALQNLTLTTTADQITTQGGEITLQVYGVFTDAGTVTAGVLPGAPVNVLANDVNLTGSIIAGVYPGDILTFAQLTSENIDLGLGTTPGDLDLSDSELGRVAAGAVRIGGPYTTIGNITLTAPITTHGGFSTLELLTGGGAILDGNSSEPDVTVGNLALFSTAGISLDTSTGTLAFENTSTQGVRISNAGPVVVQGVGLIGGSTYPIGNASPGGPTFLSAIGSITFAANVTCAGTFIVTTTGSVADTGSDVTAPTLAIQAASGIGTASAPLVTATTNFSAQTGTGGIFLNNNSSGSLNIYGGVIGGVNGIQVTSSGDIQITTLGSLLMDLSGDGVTGPGNVTLTAAGPASDISMAGTGVQSGLNATLIAGEDVLVGITSTPAQVNSGGNLTINAGRDLAEANLGLLDAHGGSAISVTVGRNISENGRIYSESGPINLTTGAGGSFSITGSNAVNSATLGNGAPIIISADNIGIQLTAAINAATSTVTLQQATTAPRQIDLGLGTTAGDLNINNSTLARVTAALLTIGRADNPGNIVLTALVTSEPGFSSLWLNSGGAIVQNNELATDISLPNLAMTAPLGTGSIASPISTQVSNLSAQSSIGGIFISNIGSLNVSGGPAPGMRGIQVTTSGDIQLSNSGTLTITTNGDTVISPGNVTVTATGASSDLQTGGDNSGVNAAIQGGVSTTVTAGRDLIAGSNNGWGDIDSGGNLSLSAGRDLIVTSTTFVQAHGGGTLVAFAARNLNMITGLLGTDSGAINLSAGGGGTFSAGNNAAVNSAVLGAGAPVLITADDVALSNGSAIIAGTGPNSIVTFQQATRFARNIDLGLGATAGDLGLSDAELGLITANIVRIGRPVNAGNILLTGPVTAHPGFNTLSLLTAGAILDNNTAEPDVSVTNLALRAGSGISLDTAVVNLAFRNATSGSVRISNTGPLTIAPVDTLDGSPGNELGNLGPGGTITLTSKGITVNSAITAPGGATLNGSAASDTFQFNVGGSSLPSPLSINGGGGKDSIALANAVTPLPAQVHLNGLFTITGLIGANPLANTSLDLGSSTVFITYAAGADPLAAIRGYLKNGYNNGGWNGTPTASTGVITSQAAQADPLHNMAIGFADSADGTGTETAANTIELKYTVYGDANLDGTANLIDLLALTRHFGQAGGWDVGDFNYDNTMNLADFLTLTRHFGQVAPAAPALEAAAGANSPSAVRRRVE